MRKVRPCPYCGAPIGVYSDQGGFWAAHVSDFDDEICAKLPLDIRSCATRRNAVAMWNKYAEIVSKRYGG